MEKAAVFHPGFSSFLIRGCCPEDLICASSAPFCSSCCCFLRLQENSVALLTLQGIHLTHSDWAELRRDLICWSLLIMEIYPRLSQSILRGLVKMETDRRQLPPQRKPVITNWEIKRSLTTCSQEKLCMEGWATDVVPRLIRSEAVMVGQQLGSSFRYFSSCPQSFYTPHISVMK